MSIVYTPVTSSNIDGLGYDEEAGDLHVVFTNGARWAYAGVPKELHDRLLSADSVGKLFAAEVKPNYEGRRL